MLLKSIAKYFLVTTCISFLIYSWHFFIPKWMTTYYNYSGALYQVAFDLYKKDVVQSIEHVTIRNKLTVDDSTKLTIYGSINPNYETILRGDSDYQKRYRTVYDVDLGRGIVTYVLFEGDKIIVGVTQ